MIKILSSTQIKELDAYTIKHEPITSIELMERACNGFVHWFTGKFDASKKVGVVCGSGNNGGDGLGVARLLSDWGYSVKVFLIQGGNPSDDFQTNLGRLPARVDQSKIDSAPDKSAFADFDVIVDAIFGSGLSRPVAGLHKEVIELMNAASATKVAIDIPSGLFADKHTEGIAVRADFTVSFQLPKLSFLLPENENIVGRLEVINIGLSKKFQKESEVNHYLLSGKSARKILRPRSRVAHKGDFGKALLIAGSKGKIGACILAAKAAMRSGLGLLTVHVPKVGYSIVQSCVPEAMATVDSEEDYFSGMPEVPDINCIGIGPGIDKHDRTIRAFRQLLERWKKPMVIDADAINILSAHKDFLKELPPNSILTPHPGEFKRLVGDSANDFQRLEKASKFASDFNCILVLKGANTAICAPDRKIYFNSTGNPGMATGGSGDVLTGVLTGILAQGYPPLESALLGVYLHGLAGDRAAIELGVNSVIASDIIDHLPEAFRKIELS